MVRAAPQFAAVITIFGIGLPCSISGPCGFHVTSAATVLCPAMGSLTTVELKNDYVLGLLFVRYLPQFFYRIGSVGEYLQ